MLDIILFAAFAVFIGFRLYNALGRKDFSPDETTRNNIVKFPDLDKAVDVKFEEVKDDTAELQQKYGADLTTKIKDLQKLDAKFNEADFLAGAKKAFEIILNAFSSGDKEALKPLLSKEIFKVFEQEIDGRQNANTIAKTTLVAILDAKIKDVLMFNKWTANITIEILSEQIRIVTDKDGKLLEGDPSSVDKISETWTFSRNLLSPNPNWELVETM
jgi:predicted lipid-binding transport protein (Tim44 family)